MDWVYLFAIIRFVKRKKYVLKLYGRNGNTVQVLGELGRLLFHDRFQGF